MQLPRKVSVGPHGTGVQVREMIFLSWLNLGRQLIPTLPLAHSPPSVGWKRESKR